MSDLVSNIKDYDELLDFLIEYTKDFSSENCSPYPSECVRVYEECCKDGTFSLGEIFENAFKHACRNGNYLDLKYMVELYPDHNTNLAYNKYMHVSDVIKKDTTDTLLYFFNNMGLELNEPFKEFYQAFISKNSPNVCTRIVDTYLFNQKLEESVVGIHEYTGQKRKI